MSGIRIFFADGRMVGCRFMINPPGNEKTYPTKREKGKTSTQKCLYKGIC